jgi:hypothetical protein
VTFLLACAVRSAAIVAIGLALSSLLRRSSAAARHACLATAMLCASLVPIVMLASPEWTLKMPAGFREVYGLEKVIPSAEPQPVIQKAPFELPVTT